MFWKHKGLHTCVCLKEEHNGGVVSVLIFYLSNHTTDSFDLSIYLYIYVSMYRPFFQFHDLLHSRYDYLDGGSAGRKAATCIQNNINTE
jgi:hypothetical protein